MQISGLVIRPYAGFQVYRIIRRRIRAGVQAYKIVLYYNPYATHAGPQVCPLFAPSLLVFSVAHRYVLRGVLVRAEALRNVRNVSGLARVGSHDSRFAFA